MSSGYDSGLPMQGAHVQSLVGEQRSHVSCGLIKKKKKITTTRKNIYMCKLRRIYIRQNLS